MLDDGALAARMTYFGTARESGGPFENRVCVLLRFGADGRVTSVDLFEAEQEVDALAHFDELTAASSPGAVRRRVRPNAVSATGSQFMAAFAAGDADALAALVRDEYRELDHSTGSEWGRDAALASIDRLLRSRDPRYDLEELATLGERLGLNRRRTRASGDTRGKWDVGPYEHEAIQVFEVAEDGRWRSNEAFAADRLGDAIVRLYEMYGESQADESERARARRIAYSVATWNGPIDLDHLRTAYAPECRNVDHRVFSTWDAGDREDIVRHLRLQLDLVPDFAGRYDDVIALDDRALAARMTYFGTARDSGGALENSVCALFLFGDDGCVSYSELFESEQVEQVLARFVELTADAALPSPASLPPAVANLAQRAFERQAAQWRARDWDGFARQLVAHFRFEDRRPLSQVVMDVDAYVRFVRALGDMASATLHVDYIAARGERLCLAVIHPTVAEGDVGPSDLEYLYLIEADEHERTEWMAAFDWKDLDAAYAELDRRFEDREGAPGTKGRRSARSEIARESFAPIVKRTLPPADALSSYFANAATRFNARLEQAWALRDREAVAALHSETRDVDDRRRLLRLRIEDDRIQTWVSAWLEMPDGRITVTPIATRGEHLALAGVRLQGNLDEEGGDFAIDFFTVAETDRDGRNTAIVLFDPEDIAAAYAELERRFDTGDGAALEGFVGRWVNGIARRDWEALIEMCSPGLVEHDHRPLTSVGTTNGRETFVLNNVRSWIDLAPDTMFRCAHVRTSGRAILWQPRMLRSRASRSCEPRTRVSERQPFTTRRQQLANRLPAWARQCRIFTVPPPPSELIRLSDTQSIFPGWSACKRMNF